MTPQAAHIPRTAAAPAPAEPADDAQKRAIARAVWTDLLWLMPQDRTVTVTVRDGSVAVDLGSPADA
ncbi:MAG: hypothetical protein OXI20_00035 [Rhodospirillales bacterium]|nr:hypothetical protein [Rhodospirillales bacterium]